MTGSYRHGDQDNRPLPQLLLLTVLTLHLSDTTLALSATDTQAFHQIQGRHYQHRHYIAFSFPSDVLIAVFLTV